LLCFWSNKISRLSINPIFQLTFKKLHLILELANLLVSEVGDRLDEVEEASITVTEDLDRTSNVLDSFVSKLDSVVYTI
ncbi:hypothetical protein, partial [Sulfurimonas sp.]|uniref:hypothetical protein n=1 Tax=Sulfurimonas sp. TaxID=2022749 RepID=UPI0025D10916